MNLGNVDTFAVHYSAANSIGDPVRFLRSTQSYYLRGRGYSIGYNFAISQAGAVYELRGWGLKCAANRGWNHRTIAVIVLVDGQDQMTAAAVASLNDLYAEAERRTGRPLALKGHRDIGSTSCPGEGVYAQILAGLVRPTKTVLSAPKPTPKQSEEDDMTQIRWRPYGFANEFLLGGAPALHLAPDSAAAFSHIELVVESRPHAQALKSVLHQAGLTEADLVRR